MTDDRPPYDPDPPWDPTYDPPPKASSNGRTPPQDVLAERAVLGAMLISRDAIPDVATVLQSSDFYRPEHEQLYRAIVELHTTGQAVDMVTVAAELARRRHDAGRSQLDILGGPTYLHDLAHNVPLAQNAAHYAGIVRDAARLRAFTEVGSRLTQLGHAGDVTRVDAYLGEAAQVLDDAIQRFGPAPGSLGPGTGLQDLSWVLNGAEPRQPPPVYVRRADGTALFYAGKVNGIFGDPEHGKTWAAQLAAVQALNDGGTAAMIDVDHNGPSHTAGRLLLLGATLEQLADPNRFRYYEPHEGPELLAAVDDITLRAPDVVIVDSLGEVFPMLGVKTNDSDEITTAMRQVCTRPALAGSCVITIDHLPKSNESRSTGFAIGTVAKKRMIRGAYLRAEAKVKPAPGAIGRITLRIEKDTSGELRRSSGGGYAGTLILDSTHDHVLTWAIKRDDVPKNDDGTWRPTTVMELVAKYIELNNGCTQRDIERDVPGKDKTIRAALQVLVTEGFIRREPGPRRSMLHHSEIPYREAEDDHANPAS